MNSIKHQLEEIHALDSKEVEEEQEELTDIVEEEAADEKAAASEESSDPELPAPPQMESQSLDEPEIPSVTTDELTDPDEPDVAVDELSDPVANLPQGEPEPPAENISLNGEQSTVGLLEEPSIPAGGEVDQSSLSLSGDDDVPSPPVLGDVPDEPEPEETQPPEPEVPRQDADFGLPNDSDDQETALDDMTSPDASVAEPISTESVQNRELQQTDPFGNESFAQHHQQHQQGQDFVKSLADSLDPAFNELRDLQQQYVYDYVQRQVLVTTLNGRVY